MTFFIIAQHYCTIIPMDHLYNQLVTMIFANHAEISSERIIMSTWFVHCHCNVSSLHSHLLQHVLVNPKEADLFLLVSAWGLCEVG